MKVWVGAELGQVQQVSGEGSGATRFRRRFREALVQRRCGRLWCRACRLGSIGFREVLVQRQVRFNRVLEKVPEGRVRKSQFYFSFWRSNLISCERVAPDPCKSQFFFIFWRSNFVSCEKVARDACTNRNFTSVFDDRTSFRAKGLRFVSSGWHCPAP